MRNVETFIIFRASTPLVVSVLDVLFLGRQLPDLRSAFCLLALLLCAAGYALTVIDEAAGCAAAGLDHDVIWFRVLYC